MLNVSGTVYWPHFLTATLQTLVILVEFGDGMEIVCLYLPCPLTAESQEGTLPALEDQPKTGQDSGTAN